MGILIDLINKLFLISLFLSISIISKDKFWENQPESPIDYKSLGIESINSVAYDNENDYELILANKTNGSYFFLIEDGVPKKEIKNTFNVKKIQSPLIKHNDSYFFCSSHLKLLYIKDEVEDDNLYEFNERCSTSFDKAEMKCFKMKELIAIMYLNTHCFFALNLTDFKSKSFTLFDNNNNFKAINNAYKLNNSIAQFIILRKLGKIYYLTEIKFNDTFIKEGDDVEFDENAFNFHENIEITPLDKNEVIIFTYDNNKENGCLFYRVSKVKNYTIQVNGLSNFLKFLNESKIHSAGFVENSSLLYYSINNINNGEIIGVADLINLMVIYNSKINNNNSNLNLFTNNGYLNKNK